MPDRVHGTLDGVPGSGEGWLSDTLEFGQWSGRTRAPKSGRFTPYFRLEYTLSSVRFLSEFVLTGTRPTQVDSPILPLVVRDKTPPSVLGWMVLSG